MNSQNNWEGYINVKLLLMGGCLVFYQAAICTISTVSPAGMPRCMMILCALQDASSVCSAGCLICYMMIETDVKTLRKMASDLTTSMATLHSQQNLTKEYRPFVDRLNFTNHAVDNLNDFVSFLADCKTKQILWFSTKCS